MGPAGLPELVIMVIIIVVVFGAFRLEERRGEASGVSGWSRTDWILLVAAVVAIGVATTLSITRR